MSVFKNALVLVLLVMSTVASAKQLISHANSVQASRGCEDPGAGGGTAG